MNHGQSKGNNKYSQNNNNKINNQRNEYNTYNQREQGISQPGQQFPNQKLYSYDKKKVPNYNFQVNEEELKQKYSDNKNLSYNIYGSDSLSIKSDNNYNDNEILKENKKLKELIQELKNRNKDFAKILEDKEKEIEKLKKDNTKLKKDLDYLRNLNKNLIQYKGSISISPEGKYIFNPNNNQSNKNNLEDIERREKELNEREKEFNKKINFLEDLENQIEIEKNELINLKQKYGELNSSSQTSIQSSSNQSTIVKIKPLDSYKSPSLIGLNNIGALNIMNSTLQCLSQTKGLTNYFLSDKNKEKIINNKINNKNVFQLSPIYLELIQKLWDKNGPKSYSPDKMKNIIEQMNPSFKAGQIINANEFIDFILIKFHQELCKNNNSNQNNGSFDPYNQQSSLMNSITQGSIITDLFSGYHEETIECIYCINFNKSRNQKHPIRYSYKIFNCLDFPLEKVKKMKNDSLKSQNISINNNRVSLYECFYYNNKSNSFTFKGEKNKNCQKCGQISDFIFTKKVFISPNNLILILNRGKGNVNDVKLDFSEVIDITQFVIHKDIPQLIYNLYGVITQIGQSGSNTHFVASCKSPIDNKWYRYNDAYVSPITNIQKEVIEYGEPFVLFYEKLK